MKSAITNATKEIFKRETQQKISGVINITINTEDPNQEWEKLKNRIKETAESI